MSSPRSPPSSLRPGAVTARRPPPCARRWRPPTARTCSCAAASAAPPTPARAASPRHDVPAILSGLAGISHRRRDLDQHEHDLIAAARDAGATWQQIAATVASTPRRPAKQPPRTPPRLINAETPAEPLEDVI